MGSPTENSSVGMRSLAGSSISVLPTNTYRSRRLTALTVPETISPMRFLNSVDTFVRSISRIFCMIIWREVCAAMRPRRAAGISISIASPSTASGLMRRARARVMKPVPVSSFDTTIVSYTCNERSLRLITTRRSFVTPGLWLAACLMAPSIAVNTDSRSTPRSRSM